MSVNLVLNLVSKVKVRLFHARCRCFEAAGILYGGHAGGCRAVGERHSPYDSTRVHTISITKFTAVVTKFSIDLHVDLLCSNVRGCCCARDATVCNRSDTGLIMHPTSSMQGIEIYFIHTSS